MSGPEMIDSHPSPEQAAGVLAEPAHDASELAPLLQSRPVSSREEQASVVVGELLALADGGSTPLLRYPGQHGSAAVRGQTIVDLHGQHIGRRVVLNFEGGDMARPIVMGVMRGNDGQQASELPGQVQVDADGERMVVSAKSQLVLRCGEASITLTRAGKVLIQGTYVSSRSSGAQRIKGGSVQIN